MDIEPAKKSTLVILRPGIAEALAVIGILAGSWN
jgi:hypothetical protein